jgi:hypothetical protein
MTRIHVSDPVPWASPDKSTTVNARCFVDLAQAVSQATRSCGLAPPGFQTLPRLGTYGRVLRRTRGGAVVAIRTMGKSPSQVRDDMIDGVIRLQGDLSAEEQGRLRDRLRLGSPVETPHDPGVTRPRPMAA